MGASLDWSREAYTLDEPRSFAVRTAFKKMHDLGLVYRGNRVVNWDPKAQTVISDDEVIHEERKAKLYTFRYGTLANGDPFPVPIATTRPETKVGDTAVAVHPGDPRYKKFIGKEYDVEFVGVPLHIKVIGDESVEKDFGTGALGVTPAHSMADWEMAQKHKLPLVQVIDEHARMTVAGELNGKKTEEARAWIVEELRTRGLLEKEEEVPQNISLSDRTGAVVEPLPKLQWFVAVDKKFKLEHSQMKGIKSDEKITLKELMRTAVASGEIKILPERFEKIYFHWIENLRTGASRGSSGSGTGSPHGTERRGKRTRKFSWARKRLRVTAGNKIRTRSIPGSLRACGRSARSVGRRKRAISRPSIRPHSWIPAMRSFRSGSRG